jgi:hypothetical protein
VEQVMPGCSVGQVAQKTYTHVCVSKCKNNKIFKKKGKKC